MFLAAEIIPCQIFEPSISEPCHCLAEQSARNKMKLNFTLSLFSLHHSHAVAYMDLYVLCFRDEHIGLQVLSRPTYCTWCACLYMNCNMYAKALCIFTCTKISQPLGDNISQPLSLVDYGWLIASRLYVYVQCVCVCVLCMGCV